MKVSIKNKKVYIDEVCILVLIICILFPRARKYFTSYYMCFLFITFHELAHMVCLSVFGIKVSGLHIRVSGLNIDIKEKIDGIKGIIIYLAGPISNFVLAYLFKNIPMIYEINMVLGSINLIPIYPLDGYNIFEIIVTKMTKKEIGKKILEINTKIVLIILLTLGVMLLVRFLNPSLIILSIYIYFLRFQLKDKSNSEMYQKYYKNVTKF